jgi:hypothetical protein
MKMKNAYKRLVIKPEAKQLLGRPRCNEDNINMVLILLELILETGCESDDLYLIVQWRVLERKVRNFRTKKRQTFLSPNEQILPSSVFAGF